MSIQHRRYMMGVVMCLMFIPPGMWVTSLPNVLARYDAHWVLPYATAIGPFLAIFSALIFGALSDRKVHAEKLLGILALSGAGFLWLGLSSLKWGWHPGWYLFFQGTNALISGPMIPLITKIKLANLENAERSFPLYSMCGTLGWIAGGVLVSLLGLDSSPDAGRLASLIRLCMGALCFLLPATPPKDHESTGWKAALGLTAFGLLKQRELRVFYIASALFAIPCVSFVMLTPIMLKEFGSNYPTAQMTFGQCVEIVAMLFLSLVAGRFRIRWFLISAMLLGVLRFALFALAGQLGVLQVIWLGIALHGPIYTFMAVTGRIFLDKRVPETMRGQAQALYMLLSMNLAGVAGAFICGGLYEYLVVGEGATGWVILWSLLSLSVLVPLVYFCLGLVGKQNEN